MALGKQVLGDLYGCRASNLLSEASKLQELMKAAAAVSQATVETISVKTFPNGGVSVNVIVSESHLAIHTWPEYNTALVDIFTCGDHTKPLSGLFYLIENLKPDRIEVKYIERGQKF